MTSAIAEQDDAACPKRRIEGFTALAAHLLRSRRRRVSSRRYLSTNPDMTDERHLLCNKLPLTPSSFIQIVNSREVKPQIRKPPLQEEQKQDILAG
jgi:hypothetical protein